MSEAIALLKDAAVHHPQEISLKRSLIGRIIARLAGNRQPSWVSDRGRDDAVARHRNCREARLMV